MKITSDIKKIMVQNLTKGILNKLNPDDFNKIFYDLFLYHNGTKLLPYKIFKESTTDENLFELSCDVDDEFKEYLQSITTKVVSPFDKGRKVVKVLKNIQITYGDKLAYTLCSPSSMVVILYLFINDMDCMPKHSIEGYEEKIEYLKKYILLLLYTDKLKQRGNKDTIMVEFLKRDVDSILDIDISIFKDEE